MTKVRLSIDRGPAMETELIEETPNRWTAGPVSLRSVDVTRDGHYVVITDGERSGWEATAGHEISRDKPYVVFLHGREAFRA